LEPKELGSCGAQAESVSVFPMGAARRRKKNQEAENNSLNTSSDLGILKFPK